MRLTRLYSNKPELFTPISFHTGLNLVVAEIRIPHNRNLDTHNLGKSTLCDLIDFMLLKGKSSKFFLFAHQEIFDDFVFYMEIELDNGSFVTIRRTVKAASKVSFVSTRTPIEDASALGSCDWDHYEVAFKRAKILLDGYLGFETLGSGEFRKLSGYLLRSQRDYSDVFQLAKFSGKHRDWKPFVAQLLGLSSGAVADLYARKAELEETRLRRKTLAGEWGEGVSDSSTLDGLISVKKRDIEARELSLDSLDLGSNDARVSEDVVEELAGRVSRLNEERYHLQQKVKRIAESLEQEQIFFRPRDAERLFRESGILLGDQVKKSYDQLIEFNRQITEERRQTLEQQSSEAMKRIAFLEETLKPLNKKISDSLAYLRESEALKKFKQLSDEVIHLKSELLHLEQQREAAGRLVELRRKERTLTEAVGRAVDEVEKEIETASGDEKSMFGRIRYYFSSIIHEVLGQDAILTVKVNNSFGIDFDAQFIDAAGLATSEDSGNSYRKLLCIAFDLAVLRAHLNEPFARFVYHDGAFEQLDKRKQEKLLGVFRKYAALGIQPIATALDSDLEFADRATWSDDVALWLHDEGADGRLFKTSSW